MLYDVVLLTQGKYVNPIEIDWYTQQVLTEDELVQHALEARGLIVTKKDWADPEFDWTTTKTALFRTTWDYFHRFNEFEPWLNQVSKQTMLINPAEQIKWNMDKHYLSDLAQKGIPIVPTHFLKRGTTQKLRAIHAELGWKETVLKPTVSGAGRHTYRLNPDNYAEHELLFAELIQKEDFMLQPFQQRILTDGEVSHIVLGGKYSHSIIKLAKKGDYRVQDDFGGTTALYAALPDEKAFAENAVSVCNPQPIYARVDVIWDNNGDLALGELELIEPELWFRHNNKAAGKLAEAIYKRFF